MVEVQGGAERTGLYYTLASAQLTASEAAYIINDCGATVVFTTSRMAVAVELPALCPDVERWIMVDGANDPFEDYATVTAAQPVTPVADEQLGMPLSYSSGTTGKPKGVLRPMRDMRPSDPLPIRPRNLPSSPSRLNREYNHAPRAHLKRSTLPLVCGRWGRVRLCAMPVAASSDRHSCEM